MHKSSYLIMLTVLLPAAAPLAAEREETAFKDFAGFGLGALVGGVLGGPIGAVAGAAGGGWLGAREIERDRERQQLENKLAARSARLQELQQQLAALEQEQALQAVRLRESPRLAGHLSEALQMTVYFRTDSARLEPAALSRLEQLADLLADYPDIRVHLSGHADRRGSAAYNRDLSRRRAEGVGTALQQAGLAGERLHLAAYGQSRPQATAGDLEAYIFDRRVIIELRLDDPL